MEITNDDSSRIKALCNGIRKDNPLREELTDEQIVVIDLINLLYSSIAYKYLVNNMYREIRAVICVVLTLFFGNGYDDWKEMVTEKLEAAIAERKKGNHTYNVMPKTNLSIKEIVETIQFSEMELIEQFHDRYGVEMPEFYIKRNYRKTNKNMSPKNIKR